MSIGDVKQWFLSFFFLNGFYMHSLLYIFIKNVNHRCWKLENTFCSKRNPFKNPWLIHWEWNLWSESECVRSRFWKYSNCAFVYVYFPHSSELLFTFIYLFHYSTATSGQQPVYEYPPQNLPTLPYQLSSWMWGLFMECLGPLHSWNLPGPVIQER